VVICSLVEELLQQGYGVTVLAHASPDVVGEWAALMRSRGWSSEGPSALIVHHIPALVDELSLSEHACSPKHLFLFRSGVIAEAVGRAYGLHPFDVLELFDYAGSGFDLLRRLRMWQTFSGVFRPPPLPPHIPIVVRLHGTVQLIHQSERALAIFSSSSTPPACSSKDDSSAWPLMYLMERYALLGAHAVFAQSQAMVDLYTSAYGLAREQVALAPPPMGRVLAPFAGATWKGGPKLRGGKAAFRLLVYGRVARMKGSETIAHAIPLITQGLPPGTSLSVVFVGIDWPCPVHSRPTSKCVQEIIQGQQQTGKVQVTFEKAIDRAKLCAVAQGFHGGVIASEFETFNLAAHELAACGLPLITSGIPALREFFTPLNAYPFQTAEPSSLAMAALGLYKDCVDGEPRTAQLVYADPVESYRRLVALARSDPEAMAQHDANSLLATDFSISIQSRGCFESYECKRQWWGELDVAREEVRQPDSRTKNENNPSRSRNNPAAKPLSKIV
jgi:glycosyltransferase involved in cell wall biosynthesis